MLSKPNDPPAPAPAAVAMAVNLPPAGVADHARVAAGGCPRCGWLRPAWWKTDTRETCPSCLICLDCGATIPVPALSQVTPQTSPPPAENGSQPAVPAPSLPASASASASGSGSATTPDLLTAAQPVETTAQPHLGTAALWTASRPASDDAALFALLAAPANDRFAPIHSQGLRRLAAHWRLGWLRLRRWSWIELWWGALLPVLVYTVGITHLYQLGRQPWQGATWPGFVVGYPLLMMLIWRIWSNARANAWLREQFHTWRESLPVGLSALEFAAALESLPPEKRFRTVFASLWQECDEADSLPALSELTPPDRIGASAALKRQILTLREPAMVLAVPELPPAAAAVELPHAEMPAEATVPAEPPAVEIHAVETPALESPAMEPQAVETHAVESPAAESMAIPSLPTAPAVAPEISPAPVPVPVPVPAPAPVPVPVPAPAPAPLWATEDLRSYAVAVQMLRQPPALPNERTPLRRRISTIGTIATVIVTVVLLGISANNLRRDVEIYIANTQDDVVDLYVDGKLTREVDSHWVEHFYIPDAGRHSIELRTKAGARLWRRSFEFAGGSYCLNPENDAWQFVWHEFHLPGEHTSEVLPGRPTRGIIRLPASPDWGPNDALGDRPGEGTAGVRTWLQLRHIGGDFPDGGDDVIPPAKKPDAPYKIPSYGDLDF